MRLRIFYFLVLFSNTMLLCQNYGSLPKIGKDKLLLDFELFRQGLEKHHTGLYWYTPKDSVDAAFKKGRKAIRADMNEIEFFKIVAPLVGLTKEDHTNIEFSDTTETFLKEEATYFPFKVHFLDQKMYVTEQFINGDVDLVGREIIEVNGKSPIELVQILGNYFASDGFIKSVKFLDLSDYAFAKYFFLEYGFLKNISINYIDSNKIDQELNVSPITQAVVSKRKEQIRSQRKNNRFITRKKENLEYEILNDSTAYIGVHTFASRLYRRNDKNKKYKKFLKNSFQSISDNNIDNLIIDVSQNGGGNEGNENLLYSYVADNYQKYNSACAKRQLSILNNGIDRPIKLRTFGFLGFFERLFAYTKMEDGSHCRKENGSGLIAYKKEPDYKYDGKLHVIIGPITYSGGSEFANMVFTNDRAIFVGEETGGGFFGNTSGYSSELELPHSGLIIDIPVLKFDMNVEGNPFGRGLLPHYEVIPTITEFLQNENAPLKFILDGEATVKNKPK